MNRRRLDNLSPGAVRRLTYVAAATSLGAAAIHLVVMPEHAQEYLPYGLFFAGLVLSQYLLAVGLVISPSRRLLTLGAAGSLAVVALWAVSRTTGIPIGPHPWQAEAVGLHGMAASGLELVTAQCLLIATWGLPNTPTPTPERNAPNGRSAISGRGSRIGAFFALGSAAVHFAEVPTHAAEYWGYGLFFLVLGIVQSGFAVWLLKRPSRRPALLSASVWGLLVAFWVVVQTAVLPIGPHPWLPVGLGDADLAATGLDILAVVTVVVGVMLPIRRTQPTPWLSPRVLPVLLYLLIISATGVAAALSDAPAATNMSAPVAAGEPSIPMSSLHERAGDEPVKAFLLVAEPRVIDGTEEWTFNGRVPGPELLVRQGDRVRVTLINHLSVATSIHWHGVDVPNAEDGVAGITQDAIPPRASYTYDFVARDPGTYWYHSHQDTFHQLLQGLFGALVIAPADVGPANREYTLIFHETPSGAADLGSTLGGLVVGAPSNQVQAVNGNTRDTHLNAASGERVRLRLISAIQGDNQVASIPTMMRATPPEFVLLGADYQVVALDGHDLNDPQLIGPRRLRIGIGQRYDLLFTMPPNNSVRLIELGGGETVTFGAGQAPVQPDAKALQYFDFLDYGLPALDPVIATVGFDVTYETILGEHFGFRAGKLELIHTINGHDSLMPTQYLVRQGQVVRLHIVNETNEFHGMHLHGHVMSVLSMDGRRLKGSPVHLDTLSVGPHETWDVAFVANNPGLWMFHCHVLLHAAFGMSAMVAYTGVTTPFDIGSRSGNLPE